MTFLEEQQEFAKAIANENLDDYHGEQAHTFTNPALHECISQVIQNTRKDFLRSEIEKMEGELNNNRNEEKSFAFKQYGSAGQYACESALTSIIIRYKEELKVLESK